MMRLGCLYCDRTDYDGILSDQLPADWKNVREVRSYADACREVPIDEPGVMDWETHLGVCPDCQ